MSARTPEEILREHQLQVVRLVWRIWDESRVATRPQDNVMEHRNQVARRKNEKLLRER